MKRRISGAHFCGSAIRLKRQANFKFLILKLLVCVLVLLHFGSYIKGEEFAPRITIQPNDLIAIEGESTELNCDAEGEPEPSIDWYHNGHLIKTSTHSRTTMGGSIQFLDIRPGPSTPTRPSDTGVYYCLARNSLGQARSRNASLQVAYIKQDFRAAPKDKLAAIGDTVTFDCLPQAWPEPRIQWRHDGRLIEPKKSLLVDGSPKYSVNKIAQSDLNNGAADFGAQDQSRPPLTADLELGSQDKLADMFGSQLVIRQVDKNDEGKYSCLIESRGTHRLIERESPSAQLTTSVKPYFIKAPESKIVQVGGQVKLNCKMGGDPTPVISWRKHNGQPLTDKAKIDPSDKTLTLDHVTASDQGTYVCEGENLVGSARATASVSVNSRPRFTVQPEDQEVDKGARVQIKCAGEASPAPILFWYKEGHRQLMFPSNINAPKQQAAALDWPQAAPLVSTDHRYGNNPTSDTSPSINKLFTMPINTDQPSQSSFINNYFGNRIYVDNQGTLNVLNVTSSDTGYYACALISSVGSVMAKAKLTVRQSPDSQIGGTDYFDPASSLQSSINTKGGNPVLSNSKFDLLPPPVIKFGSTNQTLPTNTSATLVCDVVSRVAYKIQWLFESQILEEDPPRIMFVDSGALINNLRTSDSGVYTCIVTAATDQIMPVANPFEPLDSSMLTSTPPIQQSTSHSTMLKVASPMNPNIQFYRMDTFAYPSSPGPAYLVSTNGNDAITIAWAAPADSGTLPIKEYIVEHYDTSQEHLGWRVIYRIMGKESLLIDGLSADGSHFFVIRAANSHGQGPSSAISEPMRTVAGENRYQSEIYRRRLIADSKKSNYDLPNSRADINLAREKLMSITTSLLSLTPISSQSIKLHWSTQITGNSSSPTTLDSIGGISIPSLSTPDINEFLEGYSIRYRAISSGESLLSSDPIFGAGWNKWSNKENNLPSSLPLVTSYIDPQDESQIRKGPELVNYFDYSQEFNEVRVIDHNTEFYTINGLKPFTLYQFFVVPYYRDIDGVPSNILSAQTNEDRPSVAPPNLTVRPVNNTSVRLLWLHVPPIYANGILRGYLVRINRSDILNSNAQLIGSRLMAEPPKVLTLPLEDVNIAPLQAFNPDPRGNQPNFQQYVVAYDITNLTHKSFYSIQIAASTSVGPGPWSDQQNFVMDPDILAQLKGPNNDFDDVMSKSSISSVPHSYGNLDAQQRGIGGVYIITSICLIIISILILVSYLLYRRNNQKVITWKKTISEHFSNKFYMPSSVNHQSSIQQNIYDHQQHLIYSGSPQIAQQPMPPQTLWANNGCLNSSRTGSIVSHGGLISVSNDPASLNRRMNGNQVLMMAEKDVNSRFIKNTPGHLIGNKNSNLSHPIEHQTQIIHHGGDYYSVINGMAEYEELENQQRNNIPLISNADRHQTASSNSDTSCPSSVTRLLPNQNYNRELLAKTISDNQRYEAVLQQRLDEMKQPIVTSERGGLQSTIPLSPYATTNLMNHFQMPQQIIQNHQTSRLDQPRQQNFIAHNNCITVDDSHRILLNNPAQHPASVFRTLQRNPVNLQTARAQKVPIGQPHELMQQDSNGNQFNNRDHLTRQAIDHDPAANVISNPLAEVKSNLYEHIDYSDSNLQLKLNNHSQAYHNGSRASNDIISSSTSTGSMQSTSQQLPTEQQQQQQPSARFRRGPENAHQESEAHDLRVFSNSQVVQRQSDCASERQALNYNQSVDVDYNHDEMNQADETTAFRRKSSQNDNQRTRQLSKRKRQQQRNRLHNDNQKVG